ncbi:hypothetical protein [Saccharibacillus qingshengii]|uniref:hypothetical protein n=1 Tax=Saccharibacillus qingshengii TaxID=1763540 RepID=UPI00155716EA|nr:hypothetical protein [Saccharibacillus qingshengii]
MQNESKDKIVFDIEAVLASLARKRPIFHNEADFQHALAWEIKELYACTIRLEKRLDLYSGKKSYLDIWLNVQGFIYGIELKYKIRGSKYIHEGETFSLLNQGAHDIGRYDVAKDLQRLEQMAKSEHIDEGIIIFLTNDAAYYREPVINKSTADAQFRLHEGKVLTGVMKWSQSTGAGTMKGRTEPIVLYGNYSLKWNDYKGEEESGIQLKMLLIPVQRSGLLTGNEPFHKTDESTDVIVKDSSYASGPAERARAYIREQLRIAGENGELHLDLVSGDIHRALSLQNSMPSVCQAMISVSEYRFEVLRDAPSGKTSAKKLRYWLVQNEL